MKKITLNFIPKLVTLQAGISQENGWDCSRNMLSHEIKSRDVATVIVQ